MKIRGLYAAVSHGNPTQGCYLTKKNKKKNIFLKIYNENEKASYMTEWYAEESSF